MPETELSLAAAKGPARLTVFQYGMHPLTKVPVPGYLVEMADGRKGLIDTGFPANLKPTTRSVHRFRAAPEDYVLYRLASAGLKPIDVDFVICSHFDPDHCGGNDLFAHAELFVQREQYESARSGVHWRFELHRAYWDHPKLHYTLVSGDREVLPGVWLIETGGHVPGHQSVMLEMESGRRVLLTIDAVTRGTAMTEDSCTVHTFDMDPEATRRSAAKLRSIIKREGIEQVLYGHDAVQWPNLLKAPAFYR